MYNSFPGAGQYAQYGATGMGPPGMAAPGTGAPPGMVPQDAHQQGRPGAFPPNFVPPASMPNINFSAPVIRLGAVSGRPDGPRDDRERGGRRAGLGLAGGQDHGRGAERERPQPITPQTKEEIIKTVFVGGITDGCGGDEGIERILRSAGSLKKWFRATDADDKLCTFGFAEYEDPESLSIAVEVLKDIQVPVKQRMADEVKEEVEEEVEKSILLVVADENSHTYIEQWEEQQGGVDSHHKQMLLDQAREALAAVLKDLEVFKPKTKAQDTDGDLTMADSVKNENGDIVTIQLSVDDELADIPAEMRATVAQEIAAFRDRSNKRDLERLKREEEIEQQQRTMLNGRSRLDSPPPGAPTGPGVANGVPLGLRGAVPSGPKSLGSGFAKDYQKGVTFVNGHSISAASAFDDEETDASDNELENRRRMKQDTDQEKHFLEQERRWLNRERSRTAAIEREKRRDEEEIDRQSQQKGIMAKKLKEWNDEAEQLRKAEEYYADRSQWIRSRTQFRQREQALDDADREAELREKTRDGTQRGRISSTADDSLSQPEQRLSRPDARRFSEDKSEAPREPARFKLSLGAAAQRAQATQAGATSTTSKRNVAEVEGLLEDEEEDEATSRRRLIPIAATEFDKRAVSHMTEEERNEARKQLAQEIPNDKAALWSWDVQWAYLNPDTTEVDIIEERLRPFVEKKVVEYLGVQEDLLVDVVMSALKDHKKPEELVHELEGALDEEEAEVLVKKLWRMVVFYSESERRGLST